jgi:hypothetical protein
MTARDQTFDITCKFNAFVQMMESDECNLDEPPRMVERLASGWIQTFASGTVAVGLFIIV